MMFPPVSMDPNNCYPALDLADSFSQKITIEKDDRQGAHLDGEDSSELHVEIVLTIEEVRSELEERGLNSRGTDIVLRKRLDLSKKMDKKKFKTNLDFLVVVDFEATCISDRGPGTYEQEIIEFPAILIDTREMKIVDEFTAHCRPERNEISSFCTELTGITQDIVDEADTFKIVLWRFERWLEGHGLLKSNRWCIVTDGSYDLALFAYMQCKISRTPFPCYFRLFINLPTFFKWVYFAEDKTQRRPNMVAMLDHFGMELDGRHHCGIDDTRNLAKICVQMLKDGCSFRPTDIVQPGKSVDGKPFLAAVDFVDKKRWLDSLKAVTRNLHKLTGRICPDETSFNGKRE